LIYHDHLHTPTIIIIFVVVAIQVQKLLIVMHLLIGEVPERKTFDMPQYKKALVPYFELTQVGCI
jgi:hypothetical protein